MTSKIFRYTSPLFQWHLNEKSKEEFHIKIRNYLEKSQAYHDNTSKHLISTFYKYLLSNWQTVIYESGIDYDSDDDKGSEYIWIHMEKDPDKTKIKSIIEDMEEYYKLNVSMYMIPKLTTIICKKMHSPKYLAYAICEYQNKHGTSRTKDVLHTYFQDITQSLI